MMKRCCIALCAVVVCAVLSACSGGSEGILGINAVKAGETFRLSDFYPFDWDSVTIIASPMEMMTADEETADLLQQVGKSGCGDLVGSYERECLLIFWKDGQICSCKGYNFSLKGFTTLCQAVPGAGESQCWRFDLSREESTFKIEAVDGRRYAVSLADAPTLEAF